MGLGCLKEWDILMVDNASSPAGISTMKTFIYMVFRDEDLVEEGIPEVQGKGFPLAFPGDLVLIYREGQGGEAGEGVKEEVARAYDRVASTAEIQGDLDLAARVMGRLGYSPEQVTLACLHWAYGQL